MIEINNIRGVIHGLTPKQRVELWNSVAVMAPGAKYIPSHKQYLKTKGKMGWDGRTSFIKDDIFPTGLLPIVLKLLGNVPVTDNRPVTIPQLKTMSIGLRDYQKEAVQKCLTNTFYNMWWPRGVIKCPTGSGKTRIAAALIEYVGFKTLFLVHRKDLLMQTRDAFEALGITDVGLFGAGHHDASKQVTIATIQSICAAEKRDPKSLQWMEYIHQVILDEAHLAAASLAKGNTFVSVANMTRNAAIRWGLTATPNKRDVYSNQLLAGVTGDVLYSITNKELVDDGYLTPPHVIVQHTPKLWKFKGDWREVYETGIVLNTPRNDLICEWARNIPKPAIVMVQSEAHGHLLATRLGVPFLYGETPMYNRRKAAKELASGVLPLAVVSTIWDEGVDIPQLRALVLAGGGKSAVKALQRVGRALRTAPGKDKAIIVDFFDTAHHFLKRHSDERLAIWTEQGFEMSHRREV